MKESVEGSELDECTVFGDLDDLSEDRLVLLELEYDLIELNSLVDRSVPVDDASGALGSDVLDEDRDRFVWTKLSLTLLPCELVDHLVDVLAEP